MVGGDGVDGAILQSRNDALDVLGGAQRRVDPGQRPPGEDLILGEGEVLRAGLTGKGHPPLFHSPDDVHRFGSGHMADVDVGAGLLRQHGVPHDYDLLRDGRAPLHPQLAGDAPLIHRPVTHHGGVLTVAQDGQFHPLGVDQGVPHQVGVVHIASVVGQGGGPSLFQGVRVGKFLSPQAPGDCAHGVDMDSVGLGGLLTNILDLLRTVHHWVSVGHAGHGCNSTPGGGGRSGEDVLLIGQARVPEMDVQVHQSGTNHQSGGVDHLVSLRLNILLQLEHLPILDIQVQNGDSTIHRVHDPAVLNQKFHCMVPPKIGRANRPVW